MNKRTKLSIDIETIHRPGQIVLRVLVGPGAVRDWCLGLCLLSNGLIEKWSVIGKNEAPGIDLRIAGKKGTQGLIRVRFESGAPTECEITRGDLEYLMHFFLKYYRDGIADVDHIDFDAIDVNTGNSELYVTFKVPDSRPAVTQEEARRRLDEN
jgi:hypothetical protein